MQNSRKSIDHKNYSAAKDLLKNKVILITGASDGIGKVVAKTYAEYGATVILHGRNIQRLENLYDEIISAGHATPAILPLDFSKATTYDYQKLSETIEKEFGQLDGLVHNAAKVCELAPIEFTDPADWLDLMQVNINAVYLLTHSCLALLKKSNNASIITTSSSVGKIGRAYWGPYAVSKFAIEGFTQVLADELEKTNVRINAINPGATETKMRAIAFPAEDKSKLTKPLALMPSYLYLMGDDSLQANGLSINAQ